MSDLHDLIRACKDDPDDDAPRLILADWLEEHGQADRAAFIRLTVEYAKRRWPKDAFSLLDALLPSWLNVFGVDTLVGNDPGTGSGLFYKRRARRVRCALSRDGEYVRTTLDFEINFERGFAATISLGLYGCLTVVPPLHRIHPLVRPRITDLRTRIPDLGNHAPVKIDVGMTWIGNESFEELKGYDELRPVDPPFSIWNTPIKRFKIRRNEQAQQFRRRVSEAVNDAMNSAAFRIAESSAMPI